VLKSKYSFLESVEVGGRYFFRFNWEKTKPRTIRETIRVTAKRMHEDSKWNIKQGYDARGGKKLKGLWIERLK